MDFGAPKLLFYSYSTSSERSASHEAWIGKLELLGAILRGVGTLNFGRLGHPAASGLE